MARWMAYESTLSGQYEIYIERYPDLGHRQLISTGGGRIPRWSRNGRELLFTLDGRQMLAVPIQVGTTVGAGRLRKCCFEGEMLPASAGARPYDMTPDGRFLIIRSAQANGADGTVSNINVVQNWFEELKATRADEVNEVNESSRPRRQS